MNRTRLTAILLAASVLAACGGDDDDAPSDADRTDWTEAGLERAEEVAAELRAADIPCDGYEAYEFTSAVATFEDVPYPLAMASCVSTADENFEIATFDDADARAEFVTAKAAFLCRRAEEEGVEGFPGFPIVERDDWVIQPDDPPTADRLAEQLDAEWQIAGCD